MRSPGDVAAKHLLPDAASSRFLINVSSNVCYTVLNTALMMWYVPFLVHRLGVSAYGMIPLANSLVMFAAVISNSLNISINRFLAIDLNRGNDADANRTFNTALVLSFGACGILLLPIGILTYFFPVLFNVAAGSELATQAMFAGVGVTTLAAILSGTFGVASLITHRFDLCNIVRSLTLLSRVGIVALCFLVWPPSLWYVALGFIVAASISVIGDVLVWRSLTPQLHINRHGIDRHQFRELLGLSGWSTVNLMGFLLLTQVDIVVVNAMFGAEMTGRYGSVLLFPRLLEAMTETVLAVLSPAIMARYAMGDIEGMRGIATRSVKLIGIGLALPIGLLCGFAKPLLMLWLGPEFTQLDFLMVLLIGHLTVNLAIRPLAYVITAYDRVKVQGLVTIALGVANVALAVAFARWTGWGVAGVAAASVIVWTIKNVLFMSSYVAVMMRLRWTTFYSPLLAGALGTLGTALASRFFSQLWWPNSWLDLGVSAAAIAAAYGVIAYGVSLNRSDRGFVSSLFSQRRPHD